MLKRTLVAAAAAMVMCVAVAQDGTYHDNVNKNMQDNNKTMQDKSMGHQDMQNRSMYGMRTYSDLNNWADNSTWMSDVWMSMNSRDAAALQQALWGLPSAEEKAVRKALQKCHVGTDAMFGHIREHNAMSVQGTSASGMNKDAKFMMSDEQVWASAVDGLTIYEKRQLEWVWENMVASERNALMNAFRACHEHHWMGMRHTS